MSNFLGVHWMPYHQDASDFDHMARMAYSSATLFEWSWNNRDFCANFLAVMPSDSMLLCRDHPLSEQWARFLADPTECGRGHADEWQQKVREGKVHTPLARTLFLGLNEPNSNIWQREIDRYNEVFCRRMAEHGLRACAYSFGVGHPSTVDLQPTTLPDWSWYAASAAAILEGGHWVAMHEYGAASDYGWGYWCDRLQYCPYPFTVIVQEAGIDGGVVNQPRQGYLSYMSPAAYMPWLDVYLQRMLTGNRKPFVHSVQPFTYDANRDWQSFDIRQGRAELEAYHWPQAPTVSITPPTNPVESVVPLPDTSTPPQPSIAPSSDFERAVEWVLKQEGGYTPGLVGDPGGETNFGISKAANPDVDVKNLTRDRAKEIYRQRYWLASGAAKLTWPMNLLLFDSAVQHGVFRAQAILKEAGDEPLAFMGARLKFYAQIKHFDAFGRAWTRRMGELAQEAAP